MGQHGFARGTTWAFDSIVMDNEAGVSVRFSTFTLQPSPQSHLHLVPGQLSSRTTPSEQSSNPTSNWLTLSPSPLTNSLPIFTSPTQDKSLSPIKPSCTLISPAMRLRSLSLRSRGSHTLTKPRIWPRLLRNERRLMSNRILIACTRMGRGRIRSSILVEVCTSKRRASMMLSSGTLRQRQVVQWQIWKRVAGELAWKAVAVSCADSRSLSFRNKFICVEPGIATYWNDLQPGERWIGQQVLETL